MSNRIFTGSDLATLNEMFADLGERAEAAGFKSSGYYNATLKACRAEKPQFGRVVVEEGVIKFFHPNEAKYPNRHYTLTDLRGKFSTDTEAVEKVDAISAKVQELMRPKTAAPTCTASDAGSESGMDDTARCGAGESRRSRRLKKMSKPGGAAATHVTDESDSDGDDLAHGATATRASHREVKPFAVPMDTSMGGLKAQVAGLTAANESLTADIAVAEARIDELKREAEGHGPALKRLEAEKNAEIEALTKASEAARSDAQEARESEASIGRALDKKSARVTALEADVATKEARIGELEGQVASTESDKDRRIATLEAAARDHAAAMAKVEAQRDEMAKLLAEFQGARGWHDYAASWSKGTVAPYTRPSAEVQALIDAAKVKPAEGDDSKTAE